MSGCESYGNTYDIYRGTTIFYDALSENHFARKVESTTFLYNERAIRLDPHQLPHKAWQRVLLPFVYDSSMIILLTDVWNLYLYNFLFLLTLS
jgi:hypothetical protein